MSQDPRQKTWELAQVDIDEALSFAKGIQDHWYRCQSLAKVAWHVKPKAKFIKIVNEALNTAREMPEPNRIVSCSAWVVRAMAQRDDTDILSVVKELLQIIGREPNPVRQADALLLLFEAIYRKRELRAVVLTPLLKACEAVRSWKQPRILSNIALILAEDDLPAADNVIQKIQQESVRRKANEAIQKREWLGAHEFFQYYAKNVN